MTPDIKAVAEGLSDAQRAAMLRCSEEYWWCADDRVANAVHRKKLINRTSYACRAEFTPLGLAVRAYLQQETQP